MISGACNNVPRSRMVPYILPKVYTMGKIFTSKHLVGNTFFEEEESSMRRKTFGIAAVVISAICFGIVPLFMKTIIAEGSNTISATFLRFALTLLPLYVYLKVRNIPLKITGDELIKICIITLAGYSGTSLLLFFSYNYIPTGMATTLHYVYPVLVILTSVVLFKEKINKVKILCAGMCTVGLLLFYDGGGSITPLGIILALGSAVTYTIYTIMLGNSSLKDMEPLKLIFYMSAVASVEMLVIAVATGEFTAGMSLHGWLMAIVFALSITFIGVLGYQLGVKHTGAQNAAILSTLEPITSLVVGVLVYEESFSLRAVAGCVLVLVSAILIACSKDNGGGTGHGDGGNA